MKKLGLSLLAVAMVMLVAATSNAALISLYSFDDGSGTTAANSVAGIGDGTMVGGAKFGAGYIGTGAYVGVSGAALDITNTNLFEFQPYGTNDYGSWASTYSVWLKTTQMGAMYGVEYASSSAYRGSEFIDDWGTSKMWDGYKGPDGIYRLKRVGVANVGTAKGELRDGQWHLLTVACNLTTGKSGTGSINLYLDGELVGAGQGMEGNNASSGHSWGPSSNKKLLNDCSLGVALKGRADDYAVWNEQLGGERVRSVFRLGSDAEFKYGAADVQALFDLYDGPDGGTATVGGKTWQKVTSGLGASDGVIYREGGVTGLNLGGSTGAGVAVVPEPGTLSLLLAGAFGLLVFAWRKRK